MAATEVAINAEITYDTWAALESGLVGTARKWSTQMVYQNLLQPLPRVNGLLKPSVKIY